MAYKFEIERKASTVRWYILGIFSLAVTVFIVVPVVKAHTLDEEQMLQVLVEEHKEEMTTLNNRTVEFWARDPQSPRIFTEYYIYNYMMRIQIENFVKAPEVSQTNLEKSTVDERIAKFKNQLVFRPRLKMLIRWEVLTLYGGIFAIIAAVIATLSPFILRQTVFKNDDEKHFAKKTETPEGTLNPDTIQAMEYEKILAVDVRSTYRRSNELLVRSYLFLFSGIVIASVGVIIFFGTLPDGNSRQLNNLEFFRASIRPMSVLLFLETVAWFLLRQFRAGIEDFKYFHKAYTRRVDILIGLKLEKEGAGLPDREKIIASLFSEKDPPKLPEQIDVKEPGLESVLGAIKDLLTSLKDKAPK